jgi:hypothetical protein
MQWVRARPGGGSNQRSDAWQSRGTSKRAASRSRVQRPQSPLTECRQLLLEGSVQRHELVGHGPLLAVHAGPANAAGDGRAMSAAAVWQLVRVALRALCWPAAPSRGDAPVFAPEANARVWMLPSRARSWAQHLCHAQLRASAPRKRQARPGRRGHAARQRVRWCGCCCCCCSIKLAVVCW